MNSNVPIKLLVACALICLPIASQAQTAADAYKVIGIKPGQVLSGTTINVKVVPGDRKQLVSMTTYFTGKRTETEAVNVRLDVFQVQGETLVPIYVRDFGAENGGSVSDGNLMAFDLDLDGVNEIIVSYADFKNQPIEQVLGEVLVFDGAGLVTRWSGPMKYDATKAARDVPLERRDRFEREIDLEATLRTRGVTLFFNKKMIAVAGQRLDTPQSVQETFPFRSQRR